MMKHTFAIAVASLTLIATPASDWPQWRGPDRSGVSTETGLLKEWPSGGPKRLWLFENAGEGYASFAIAKGKLFTAGTRDNAECLLALDVENGRELWHSAVGGRIYRNDRGHGPRGTPTVDGDQVFMLSGEGILACANAADGKILWKQAMADFGGRPPNWGYSESVLVDGNQVVCTPGGSKGAIAAFDKATGKLLWQTADLTEGAQYSSIIIAESHGVRHYIQLLLNSLVGLDPKTGKVLWKSSWPGRTAVVPTPIFYKDHVYISSGYGVGCKLVKLSPGLKVEDVYENKVMKNHHGGVLRVGAHVYGFSDQAGWVCQNFFTGDEVWSERRALDKGAIASADGMLYCQDESSGTIVLAEASAQGWKEHGRFKLDPQSSIRAARGKVWTHPVISNGKLYLRDQELIYCYDLKRR